MVVDEEVSVTHTTGEGMTGWSQTVHKLPDVEVTDRKHRMKLRIELLRDFYQTCGDHHVKLETRGTVTDIRPPHLENIVEGSSEDRVDTRINSSPCP
jgi:hypothetical protein